ncbi:hypothetical protein ACTJKH_16515 [Microbacterium sp. 22215]|uniref:hypothetical protein n=1 Tax=Microbacterium sp. 22215 TaxID=3453893 RepID=UPI003F8269A2
MTLSALRPDSLTSESGRLAIRLSLPWIRSVPIWCIAELNVLVDDEPTTFELHLNGTKLSDDDLADDTRRWFVQDRLIAVTDRDADENSHDVSVSFTVLVPYLLVGEDAPLGLPFAASHTLTFSSLPYERKVP